MMSPGVRSLGLMIFCIGGGTGQSDAFASRAVAGQVDPVCVVDDAIEHGVSVGGIADQLVPFVDGDLAGDDGRSAPAAFFKYLEQIVTSGGIEWLEPPIVEDEQLHAAERSA